MNESLQRVQTKGSHLKKDEPFEVVVFNQKTSAVKKELSRNRFSESHNKGSEFDIKQATKEIIKLGAKGFYQRRRERTLKSLAVELGAKPEKNRYHNYKELKEIRSKNRERQEQHLNLLKESSNLSVVNLYKRKAAKKSDKKRKSDISILNNYGKAKAK